MLMAHVHRSSEEIIEAVSVLIETAYSPAFKAANYHCNYACGGGAASLGIQDFVRGF